MKRRPDSKKNRLPGFLKSGFIQNPASSSFPGRRTPFLSFLKRKNKQGLDAFFQNLPDGAAILSPKGKVVFWNMKAELYTGINSKDAIGMSARNLYLQLNEKLLQEEGKEIPEDFLAFVSNPDPEASPVTFYFSQKGKDNTIRFIEHSFFKLNFPGKGILIRDITGQKIKEETAFLYRNIFHNVEYGIAIMDTDMKFIEQNQAHKDILGFSDEELLSSDPSVFMGDKLYSEIYMVYDYQGIFQGELKIKKKNGQEIYVDIVMFPVLSDEQPVCHVSYINDISERKASENELLLAKRKAEESDRLKTAFLSNMSHEIRTPMNSILGFSSLLKESGLSDSQKAKFIGYINHNGENLLNLINDIIDISKIESNQLKIEKSNLELFTFLEEIHASLKEILIKEGKTAIELRKNYPAEKYVIFTDAFRLRQILINLLHNAIKFTDKGFIELGYAQQNDKEVLFYVKDTGMGIPAERQVNIFERFRKLEMSRNKLYGGAGLGLAITRQLVNLLGGEIWLDSDQGMGSTFYFTLPHTGIVMVDNDDEPAVDKDLLPDWHGKTIMIIEDDLFSYELLVQYLTDTGIEILHSDKGNDAVNIFAENDNIELVVMDIQLPEMNGYDATRLIKQLNPKIPVIAHSAYAMQEDRERALVAGFDDFIAKPVDVSEFFDLLSKYLD